ncbi:hypothetical protein PsorP6_000279 [Peronosclerospora sorghi]|uniref:Uncharacterized protein n=1 Tax=Peronosclerospora sorghi TaxID=230839 RepID=A0ACC0WPW0_9STRA|nr:hypothetical protein PsorP6_000279 [Peronosclerospora sorghi]
MLQRVLASENVDERRRALFRASGIMTYRQLLQRPLWDVAHAVDLSVCEMEKLVVKISTRLAPVSQSAFDLFLERVNKTTFLRTGLPRIDEALYGGLHCRALSEFVGTAGVGKSQVVMTLAVLCALDYPEYGVLFFDVEHNFSAKRLLQITFARLQLMYTDEEDINALAAAVLQRIRVVRVNSVATFAAKFKEVEKTMHSLKIKLLIIDCVSTLFIKFIMEQHALHRAITIAKSSVSGYIVQPFAVKEGGIEATEDDRYACAADDFTVHDEFRSNMTLESGPILNTARTRRPSQQSTTEDSSTTQRVEVNDSSDFQSNQDKEPSNFDIVSDSNSEEENDSFDLDIVFEE